MSRPFSYHDDNFTVIGNVLFCHIKIIKGALQREPIIEIPPEIYARMLFYTQTFTQVFTGYESDLSYRMSLYVIERDGKKYLSSSTDDLTRLGSYIVGFYILKDI